MKRATTSLMTIVGVMIGLLVFVGFVTFQAIFLISPPCSTFGCPTLTSDQVAYSTLVHILAWVGLIALDLSVALSVMLAFVLAGRNDLPETTRRSAFYFATIYLAAFIVFGLLLMSSVFGIVRFI